MLKRHVEMQTVEEARREKDWRREDLASRAHVGLTTIVRIESGDYSPRYPVRLAIATALGVSIDKIAWPEKEKKQ
jgi:DNA-binding XRE family transcriptional regulator